MYVVTVLFRIKPEHVDAFMREIVANATASREREPGCRQFDVCVAPDDPTEIFLYERYDDRAAFDAHVAAAHFGAFDAATAAWVEQKSLRVYARKDPG